MITKKEAKEAVIKLTVMSLRRLAAQPTRMLKELDLTGKASDKDIEKVKAELEVLAASLEKKIPTGRVVDQEKADE